MLLHEMGKVACSMQKLLLFLIKFAAVFFKPCQVVVDFSYQLTRASRDVVVGTGNFDIHGGYPAKFERVIKLFGFGYGGSQIFHAYHDHGRGLDVTDQ